MKKIMLVIKTTKQDIDRVVGFMRSIDRSSNWVYPIIRSSKVVYVQFVQNNVMDSSESNCKSGSSLLPTVADYYCWQVGVVKRLIPLMNMQ